MSLKCVQNEFNEDDFMKVAIIGSRNITNVDLSRFIPYGTVEIISGGAKGIDTVARDYAIGNKIKLTEFLPNYKLYGRGAPIKRNIEIIENADIVLAFWDGISHGTKYVIDNCKKRNIPVKVYLNGKNGITEMAISDF